MEQRMKEVRKSKKLTLKEIAELVHVTESAVSKYEHGTASPSDAVIRLFCDALNISEQWLRTGEGEMEVKPPEDIVDRLAREYSLDPSGVMLLRAAARVVRELPPDTAMKILEEVYSEIQSFISRPQADADAHLDRRLKSTKPEPLSEDSSSTVGGA